MLEPLCAPSTGPVAPAPRLAAFVGVFDADRAQLLSLCGQDLDAALETIGRDVATLVAR
jgi:hypothetical protein